jgi:hypothetical protein
MTSEMKPSIPMSCSVCSYWNLVAMTHTHTHTHTRTYILHYNAHMIIKSRQWNGWDQIKGKVMFAHPPPLHEEVHRRIWSHYQNFPRLNKYSKRDKNISRQSHSYILYSAKKNSRYCIVLLPRWGIPLRDQKLCLQSWYNQAYILQTYMVNMHKQHLSTKWVVALFWI